jgi:predicted phosphodiesterase
MKINKKLSLVILVFMLIMSVVYIPSRNYIGDNNIVDIWNKVTGKELDKLPSYAQNEIRKLSTKILKEQSSSNITFEFITDSHYDERSIYRETALEHFEEAKQLANNIHPDFIVHGGDIIDGFSPKNQSIKNLDIATNYILKGERSPVFLVKGNHDDNSYYNVRRTPRSTENVIFPKEMYELTVKKYENTVTRDKSNPEDMYYYRDFPNKKLRVIILNTNDIPIIYKRNGSLKYKGIMQYGISNEQLNWVAHTALNFSDKKDKREWKVIFFSHVCFLRKINFNRSIANGDVMLNIIEAFKKGKEYSSMRTIGDYAQSVDVDFTSQGPMKVIAMISGHVHKDAIAKVNGIDFITTLNSVPIRSNPRVTPIRRLNTVTENAFDVFSINTRSRIIYIYRYGAGSDRVVKY